MKKHTNQISTRGQKALILSLALSLTCTLNVESVNAQDPCSASMGHIGTPKTINGNNTERVNGTLLMYSQWADPGNGSTLTYYDNYTFQAEWNNVKEYQLEFGFNYTENVNPKTQSFAFDYSYTKETNKAMYGYIGVHGWTLIPMVEYYIIDDWYGSKPTESALGKKVGELEVDGAKYAIYANWQNNMPSNQGYDSFVQINSIRESPRQCGHINISAHFNKWAELFYGQEMSIPDIKSSTPITVHIELGDINQLNVYHSIGGIGSSLTSGTIDYTYVKLDDNYKKNLSASGISISGNSKTYNGKKQNPDKIVVKDGDKTLVLNQDYKVEFDGECINVGNYTASIVGMGDYKGTINKTFEITPKEVTVKADDKSKKPGESDPKLTATISGLVDGESASLIKYSISRIKGESEGKYTITPSGSSKQGNYIINYEKGSFKIDKNYIPTPVSNISDNESGIKVWSFSSSIYIESAPNTQYKIIDINGKIIKSAATKSTKEEVSIIKTGIYIVIIGNLSYKVLVN